MSSNVDESTATTVALPSDGRDEAIARHFFAELEHRAKVDDAIVEYEERVRENRAYEEAGSVEDLARRMGR